MASKPQRIHRKMMTSSSHGGVVVTGASSGIGAALARELALRGYLVFATVRRAEDASSLEATGIAPIVMDVTDSQSIAKARATVANALGNRPLRGLVNNAGVPCAGPLELVPLDEMRHVFEVNVLGPVAVSQAFLPMLRTARGRIINISSLSGRLAMPFTGPYAGSKFALEGISDALRRELAPTGVAVIVVQPGTVRTPIWRKVAAIDVDGVFRGSPYEGRLSRVRELALNGAKRGLQPESVARAVIHAFTARRPPARILVVSGSVLATRLVRLLPDRFVDRLIDGRIRSG